MATLTQFLPYDNGSFPNFKLWANGLSNAFTTLGWLPSPSDPVVSSTGNFGTATITNISITTNVLTVTFSGSTINFASGQVVLLTGLTTNTFLNGQYVQIQNSGTPATDHTTTTFLAPFTHGNVSSSDTGTITALYNWNTITNVPDSTETGNYSTKQAKKFRGNWVGTTPTFTNLQTTNNQTTITFATPHGLDLTRSVGQGLFIVNVANANFTWLNTNPTSPVTGIYAGWPISSVPSSTTVIINTGSSPRTDIASTAVSAGTGEPVYIGSSGASPIMNCDLVLYGGDMYENVLGTAAGVHGNANQPGTDITKWKRVVADLFVSNDSLSSTNKMYVRLQYGMTTTGGDFPYIYIYAGSSSDGSTNITQNNFWGSTTPVSMVSGSSVSTTGPTPWESNFSGTSGRFSMIMWRGYNISASSPGLVLIIDRSKDNSGNDTDAYWTLIWCNGNSVNGSVSIFKPGTGTIGQFELNANTAIHTINVGSVSFSLNNSLCIFPVFPMVGFVGNPLLGAISLRNQDAFEGAVMQATLYGTAHTYLLSKVGNSTLGGPSCFGPGTAASACGIRWE